MITNSQECQTLIQSINSAIVDNQGFMRNPEEQYKQRNKYIEVVEYAIENNQLYHLYDIWQVFAQARKEATRGFFLDLWDIYNRQEGEYKNQRETDILRYFVCQIHDQFDEILFVEKLSAPKLWQDQVRTLLIKLMWIENEQEMQLERKLLYSMSHLYVYLYPNRSISFKEEKESLIRQLQMAEEAIHCRAKVKNSSLVLAQVFSNDENVDYQREFTLSFLYLYRFANHFALISLKDFVKKVIDSLKEEDFIKQVGQETGEELLDRLLRYWGANSSLMEFFLQEKLAFKFYQYAQPEAIKLPSPYGTDNFVYTIGASGVGKTYFFHAMEYFSKKSKEQIPLSIEYIDASDESKLNRKKWEEGEEIKTEENHFFYMQSKVRNLCRFTFYEIEDTQIIEDTDTRWQSLQGYFERRLPSAIILLFTTEENNNLKSYDFVVNLLDGLAKKDERYRNIPIYFIFNKYDRLLAKIQQSQEYDRQLANDFESYLNSQIQLSEGFNFFSLRYQKEVKQIGTLEIVNRTKSCCANWAFITQLNQDIITVKKIIDSLLNKNFTNLSFIYTCSLFKDGRQYNDLQQLWSDLSNFIIKATCEDLKKYYLDEFKIKVNRDFKKVDRFCNEAAITSSLEFSKDTEGKDVFERLNKAPDSKKLEKDYNHLLKLIESDGKHTGINESNLLSLNSGFEPDLNNFFKGKNYISNFIDKALRASLKELGVPIETNQMEETQNYQDYLLKEIDFIKPEDINHYDEIWQFYGESQVVKDFLENKEYTLIKEEIKDILFQRISDYNNKRIEKDRLKITKDNLNIIIEQLPKQFQAISTANKNKAFKLSIKEKFLFSSALKYTSALCPIQCGQFEESDRSFIQGPAREQTVFERFCQLTNFEEAKKYCQFLSNYLPKYPKKPKYPQFVLFKSSEKIQIELDEVKINIIKKLDEKLKQQQALLLDMIIILLKNYQDFKNTYKNISKKYEYEKYVANLYLAQYLLKMLEFKNFNIQRFQEEPDEITKQIANAINNLSDIMDGSKAKPENMNLDKFKNDYQQIKSSSDIGLYSLNIRDISNRGKLVETELKTAFNIYVRILDLIEKDKDNERLKSLLSEDIIQKFNVSEVNKYNNLLKDYEKKRKLIILLERVEYLRLSKWIEDLQWLNESFSEYANNSTWGNLPSIETEGLDKWKQNFIENIEKLLERELFTHG